MKKSIISTVSVVFVFLVGSIIISDKSNVDILTPNAPAILRKLVLFGSDQFSPAIVRVPRISVPDNNPSML